MQKRTKQILITDDNEDRPFYKRKSVLEGEISNSRSLVKDGQEFMDYILQPNGYNAQRWFVPEIILLNLNIPKNNGLECLKEMKANDNVQHIPTLIFTTTKSEQDIFISYKSSVNSFSVKSLTFTDVVKIILKLKN